MADSNCSICGNCIICGLPPQSYAKDQGIPEVGLCPAHFREAVQFAARQAEKEREKSVEEFIPRVRGIHGYLPYD